MKNVLLRITSIFLAFVIVCSLFPVTVHAAATKYETTKDDVPVWSEASSKSTKVYRIANAGTIVEVISSTTNSSGNLWYKLTDGNWIFSGNVKKHSHKAIMCGEAEYSYEQYDANNHIITIKMPNLCSCGHVTGYEITEKLESHSFNSNDKCSDCGYQKPHEHKAVMCGQSEYSYKQYTAKEHITTIKTPDLCSCGHVMGYEIIEKAESHSFNSDNKCTKCGYQKPHEHKAVMCGQSEYSYKQYTAKEHITTIKTPNLCSCGHVMGHEITEKAEAHSFNSDNKCTKCGYQKVHEHKSVMCGRAEYSYEQYSDTEHISTITMPDLCSCGHIMGYEITEKLESHSFNSDNKCTECGYQKAHEHKSVMCGQAEYSYEQYSDTEHISTITMPDLCSCGYVMGYETTTKAEAHSFDSNSKCTECGYEERHEHKAVMCGDPVYSYRQWNASAHILTIEMANLCSCGNIMGSQISNQLEDHSFDSNNTCTKCGYMDHEHSFNSYKVLDVRYIVQDKNSHVVVEDALQLCKCGSTIGQEFIKTTTKHAFGSDNICLCGYIAETPAHVHAKSACGSPIYSYFAKDNRTHYTTIEVPNLCECGSIIDYGTITIEEFHNFVNGYCENCDAEKNVGFFDVEASQILDQAIDGNAHTGDATAAGIVGEILLGEIPVFGTVADLRDVYYDLETGAGFWQTVLDMAAIIPIVGGVIKYSDEIGVIIKHSDEIGEVAGSIKKPINNLLTGATDAIAKLSGNNIKHITSKHTYEGMAKQAKYLSDEKLASKLADTSFFNKNWSQDEVIKYTEEAYNLLRNQGKTGKNLVEVNGDIIYVIIKDDGTFDTAYGIYRYTLDDFR